MNCLEKLGAGLSPRAARKRPEACGPGYQSCFEAVTRARDTRLGAVGLAFVRAFGSGEPYDDPIPGAEQGEVEYEITRTTWQHRNMVSEP